MKVQYKVLLLFLLFICVSCLSEDVITEESGYLRLEIGVETSVKETKAVPENYRPKQLTVKILDKNGKIIESTDNAEEWTGKQIQLKVGSYSIVASSHGFDGNDSGENIPYYVGSSDIVVEKGKIITAKVVCTLANIKVSANFDKSIGNKFSNAFVIVSSKLPGIKEQTFVSNKSVYFPAGDLSVLITVVNKSGVTYKMEKNISNVKARDHYILNLKVEDTGSGNIKVDVDDTEREYIFNVTVPVMPSTQLETRKANAWSTFAYFEGSVLNAVSEIDQANLKFEYKVADESVTEWQETPATLAGDKYQACVERLQLDTKYVYRFVYKKQAELYMGSSVFFTTGTENKIPDLNFDNWVKSGKHYYPAHDVNSRFWDSGNEGANTLKEINPTTYEENDVIKGRAAKLWSTTAAGQFAAGSLFTGDFGKASINPLGAELSFGQKFEERPSRLKGWYKYNPGSITHTKVPGVNKGDRDKCTIYIALTDWQGPLAVNTGKNIFFDPNDKSVIAYGELSADKVSPAAMSKYEEFVIDLKYRDLNRKPTYILIVCSSSKYGDYFTGSTSSVLLLDEFDLVYGKPIMDEKYQNK